MGVNPEDPAAMTSIERVASTFFNAVDQKEGSPYVFREDKESIFEPNRSIEQFEPSADSDQEELDKFIAEIEDAADREWEAEEAAEKEEFTRLRYWNKEEFGGRFRRSGNSDDDQDDSVKGAKGWKDKRDQKRSGGSGVEVDDDWESSHTGDANDLESDADDSDKSRDEFSRFKVERGKQNNISRAYNDNKGFQRNVEANNSNRKMAKEDSESENMFSDLENTMLQSDSEEQPDSRAAASHDHKNRNDFESDAADSDETVKERHRRRNAKQQHTRQNSIDANFKRNSKANFRGKMAEKDSRSDDLFSDSEVTMYESDTEKDSGSLRCNYISSDEESYHPEKYEKNDEMKQRRTKRGKEVDDKWD